MVSTKATVWLIRAASVAVIVLVLYLATGYLSNSARVKVTVNNTADIAMLVMVWLDPLHEDAKSLGYLTIAAHAQSSLGSGYVHAGHHTIEVWWLPAADGWQPSGENKYTHDSYILPYMIDRVVVDIGQT